jgi:hypothetical protein
MIQPLTRRTSSASPLGGAGASQRPPIRPPLGTLFEQGRVDVLRVVSVPDTVIALVPILDVGQILWKRLAAVAQPDSVHG